MARECFQNRRIIFDLTLLQKHQFGQIWVRVLFGDLGNRKLIGEARLIQQATCALILHRLRHQLLANTLPAAGLRNYNNAALNNVGTNGFYWSSTVNSTNSHYLNFNSGNVNPGNSTNRAYGFSVRCVAELDKKRFVEKEIANIYFLQSVSN